jgi:hypothetical protein
MANSKKDPRVEELKENLAKLHVMLMMIPLIADKLTPEQKAELKAKLNILQLKVEGLRVKMENCEGVGTHASSNNN